MWQRFRLELLLILAVAILFGQIAWPAIASWWRRPSPGWIGVDELAPIGPMAASYILFLPGNYDEKASHWPLVVFLHGSGESGHHADILRSWGPFATLQNGSEIPAVIVGPQCAPGFPWDTESVVGIIDHVASTYRIDRKRVYLVGYSMGGVAACRTAAAHPTLIAAIVSICGGGQSDVANALADIPTWAFLGEKDDPRSNNECERMVKAIRNAGGSPRLTVIPNAGHGICNAVCQSDELWNWLLTNQRPARDQR